MQLIALHPLSLSHRVSLAVWLQLQRPPLTIYNRPVPTLSVLEGQTGSEKGGGVGWISTRISCNREGRTSRLINRETLAFDLPSLSFSLPPLFNLKTNDLLRNC